MSALKFFSVVFIPFFFVFPIFAFTTIASSNEDIAVSAINRAEEVAALAYEGVLEAERTGAGVSGLLARLNEAGDLLAQAHALYRLGDFDGAAGSADLCSQIGDEVRVEASKLRSLAAEEATQRFRWTVIGSILSITITVGASFVSWHIFKLRYYRRILEMKPEVFSGES